MKKQVFVRLVFLSIVLAVSFALVPAAFSQPGEFVKGVLQPLADGFPKKPITIIVVDDPGSRDDLYAKSIQAACKGISPVNIVVSDEPAAVGGTWFTIQETMDREGGKDGYYPIVLGGGFGVVTDLFIDPGTREIKANLDQMSVILYSEIMPYTFIQRKNAPWGPTFKGLVEYAKKNPGKLRYISKEVGTGHDLSGEWVMKEFGIRQYITDKIPQGTHQEVASVIGAGMGDFGVSDLPVAVTNWQAGKVDIILVLGETIPEIWKKDPNVVSAKQVGLPTTIVGTDLGLAVNSRVSKEHKDWLFKLFKAAVQSDVHKKRSQTIPGLVWKLMDGPTSDADHKKVLEYSEPVVKSIGMHIDQQKK